MQPLEDRLIARIAATGPITVADFMSACLLDPTHGYYTTARPFGAEGDFTTAPEVSQMFGELLGLALAQTWMDQGAPAPFVLAELGPGRGTLMADLLRATRIVPGFHDAARVTLVEASPQLREVQRATIPGTADWVGAVGDLPAGPLFLLANEFFDALPIRQFRRDKSGWSERMVTADGGRLSFAQGPEVWLAALEHRLGDTREGDLVETCAPAQAIANELGARIAQHGGAAIIVDYGGWRSRGDTLQAVAKHAFADPLADPGATDLTAHVDFQALAAALAPAKVTQMATQGAFLCQLGIDARSEVLARSLSGHPLDRHLAAHRRLTHADEMGTLFKVIAAHSPETPPPPGFEP